MFEQWHEAPSLRVAGFGECRSASLGTARGALVDPNCTLVNTFAFACERGAPRQAWPTYAVIKSPRLTPPGR
jgi:hypothetical protein